MSNRRIEKKRAKRVAYPDPLIPISAAACAKRLDRLLQRMKSRQEGYAITTERGETVHMIPARVQTHVRTLETQLRSDLTRLLGADVLTELADRGDGQGDAAIHATLDVAALPTGVTVRWAGGFCPVQVEGTVDDQVFFFRARGQRWSFDVCTGLAPTTSEYDRYEAWSVIALYGTRSEAGYMSRAHVTQCLIAAINAYRADRATGRIGDDAPPSHRELAGAPLGPDQS